ncbi:MAG: hypothetical protein V2I74_05275 [Erythrobacter sp.]|nr:hypothetical protein [Erythrobacter sp.]
MRLFLTLLALMLWAPMVSAQGAVAYSYEELIALHEELQEFVQPDFTASVALDSGARVGEIFRTVEMADDEPRGRSSA